MNSRSLAWGIIGAGSIAHTFAAALGSSRTGRLVETESSLPAANLRLSSAQCRWLDLETDDLPPLVRK